MTKPTIHSTRSHYRVATHKRPTRTWTVYSDPGHAWLKVRVEDAREIIHMISDYSYFSRGWLFLEEDIDLPEFLAFARRKYDFTLRESHRNSDSPIREFQPLNNRLRKLIARPGK